MKIGVDIRPITGLRTGIQEYTEQIMSRMVSLGQERGVEFVVFYSSLRRPAPELPWLRAPNVTLKQFRIPNNFLFFTGSVWGYPLIDELIGGVDAFFSPHFFLAPLSVSCRRVTTFHDLSYLRFPEFFTFRKRWWHTVQMDPAHQAKFSDRIISISESTKSDLIEYYHIDPSNISVIPNGNYIVRPQDETIKEFTKKRQLSDRFIFYLGTIEPRKNVRGLIEAFNVIKERNGFEDLELVIAGKKGWKFDDVMAEIKNSPFASAIRYLGHITDNERSLYYSAATVFAYPSFFEGFGSPVLEAMACGTPVVSSVNSSLPEVGGGAAMLVDPYNISDMAEALRIIITDKTVQNRMIQKGLEHVKKFTWEESAKATLDIIMKS